MKAAHLEHEIKENFNTKIQRLQKWYPLLKGESQNWVKHWKVSKVQKKCDLRKKLFSIIRYSFTYHFTNCVDPGQFLSSLRILTQRSEHKNDDILNIGQELDIWMKIIFFNCYYKYIINGNELPDDCY